MNNLDEKKKRGRPHKATARRLVCSIRMDENELSKLEYVVQKTGMSRSDVVNKAVRTLYNLEKYRE